MSNTTITSARFQYILPELGAFDPGPRVIPLVNRDHEVAPRRIYQTKNMGIFRPSLITFLNRYSPSITAPHTNQDGIISSSRSDENVRSHHAPKGTTVHPQL